MERQSIDEFEDHIEFAVGGFTKVIHRHRSRIAELRDELCLPLEPSDNGFFARFDAQDFKRDRSTEVDLCRFVNARKPADTNEFVDSIPRYKNVTSCEQNFPKKVANGSLLKSLYLGHADVWLYLLSFNENRLSHQVFELSGGFEVRLGARMNQNIDGGRFNESF